MALTVSRTTPPRTSLADLYQPIASDLAEAERIFDETLDSSVPYIRQLVKHLGHYRGKRLRPALLLLTARACGRVTPQHHQLAAVVEMIHTATLVHDDVLDHAEMRRHVATINAAWDNSTSVLLGDWLFTHAFHLAAGTGSAAACRAIGEATNGVCAGELHQVGERGNLSLSEEDYFRIIRGKTAELTACCCRLGAVFSQADDPVVDELTHYGRTLGMAFQIADDVLDLVGEEQEAGKSLGTDVEQRKLTLPLIRLLNKANPDATRRIRQLLLGADAGKVEKLRGHLDQSGAFTYATWRAEQFAEEARQALRCLPLSDCRRILEDLTHLAVHRSR
jgi:octaprenyl-diphosphate synthase